MIDVNQLLAPISEESPGEAGEETAIGESQDTSPQRNQFLEIMRAKAELMDDTELEAAIQQAEAEIQNLQASRMLTNARQAAANKAFWAKALGRLKEILEA